jgi:hypothetical protein
LWSVRCAGRHVGQQSIDDVHIAAANGVVGGVRRAEREHDTHVNGLRRIQVTVQRGCEGPIEKVTCMQTAVQAVNSCDCHDHGGYMSRLGGWCMIDLQPKSRTEP